MNQLTAPQESGSHATEIGQKCRFCSEQLTDFFCDLGKTPPSNAYLTNRKQKESIFPLQAYVCPRCFLVQLGQFQTPDDIFGQYLYFSSFSKTWVDHAKKYVDQIVERQDLGINSLVVEIASNDGYLLQHFCQKKIPCLGIEPAKNVALVAQARGIPTRIEFFGLQMARRLKKETKDADLIIGNNVLAHVPNINDFVAGLNVLLAPKGIITLEFPHLMRLMEGNQFDTIYHEHFSYFSLLCVEKIFAHHGLELFDVEQLSTHGGSLRVYLQHVNGEKQKHKRVIDLHDQEISFGLNDLQTYRSFSHQVQQLKNDILLFFQSLKNENKTIAGYGAPAKGNTLLNYCGVTSKQLPFTVDISPHKQKHFLPGSHIPIYSPEKIFQDRPDYLLILPWNLKDEIMIQMKDIRKWGGQFVTFIPKITVE